MALYVNGEKQSGADISITNANGVFIDTDNVIVAQTTYTQSSSWSYTATEDCIVYLELFNNQGYGISATIDGKTIVSHYDDIKKTRIGHYIYLKKGQVLALSSSSFPSDVTTNYAVYGIQPGSSGGGSATDLASLTDVDLTNPTDGQLLKYDATSGKWVNGDVSADDLAYDSNTSVKEKIDEIKVKIQRGTFTKTGVSASWVYEEVTFDEPYTDIPLVSVSNYSVSHTNNWGAPEIDRLTRYGFRMGWWNRTGTEDFMWQAIGI